MLNVLVICTGNSCRSVLSEALFNHLGRGRIKAFSAGSHPVGSINTDALATLKRHGLPVEGYKSQSWEEFEDQAIDMVITVCNSAAGETCPVYLSQTVQAHWGVSDPGHVEGTVDEKIAAFEKTFKLLQQRIQHMLKLPLETLPPKKLASRLNEIGKLPTME